MTETDVATAVRYCGAPTESGAPCRQIVTSRTTGRCIFHDPARAVEAATARRRGGEAAHARDPQPEDVPPPSAPKTLADVIAWHSWVAVALASGQIDKAVATGTAYNLQMLRTALVARDLEREVEELRAQVAALKSRRAA